MNWKCFLKLFERFIHLFAQIYQYAHVRSYLEKPWKIVLEIAIFYIFWEYKFKNQKTFDEHWKAFLRAFRHRFQIFKIPPKS